jgi:hypothetical protein
MTELPAQQAGQCPLDFASGSSKPASASCHVLEGRGAPKLALRLTGDLLHPFDDPLAPLDLREHLGHAARCQRHDADALQAEVACAPATETFYGTER